MEKAKMKETIDVQIGEVKTERRNVILQSKAIGSCVAIAAYDAVNNTGAMVHIMLPGKAPVTKKPHEKTKYAANAISAMVGQMNRLGSKNDNIEVVLVGGGNVLNRKDDTICKDNIKSALELLRDKYLKVRTQAIGGTDRRSISLDIESGIVYLSEGNGSEIQLWKAQKPEVESPLQIPFVRGGGRKKEWTSAS